MMQRATVEAITAPMTMSHMKVFKSLRFKVVSLPFVLIIQRGNYRGTLTYVHAGLHIGVV